MTVPEYHAAGSGRLPVVGDLIVMRLPESEPVPPGWTMVGSGGSRGCWRYATGGEHSFPFPAAWYRGVEPVSDAGTAAPFPSYLRGGDPT